MTVSHGRKGQDRDRHYSHRHSHSSDLAVHQPQTTTTNRKQVHFTTSLHKPRNMGDSREYDRRKSVHGFLYRERELSTSGTRIQTFYTLTISNVNQTIDQPYVKGFGLRVESVTIQDSMDGPISNWGIGSNITDAVQVNGLFTFRTAAFHQLRFTVTYQL